VLATRGICEGRIDQCPTHRGGGAWGKPTPTRKRATHGLIKGRAVAQRANQAFKERGGEGPCDVDKGRRRTFQAKNDERILKRRKKIERNQNSRGPRASTATKEGETRC